MIKPVKSIHSPKWDQFSVRLFIFPFFWEPAFNYSCKLYESTCNKYLLPKNKMLNQMYPFLIIFDCSNRQHFISFHLLSLMHIVRLCEIISSSDNSSLLGKNYHLSNVIYYYIEMILMPPNLTEERASTIGKKGESENL